MKNICIQWKIFDILENTFAFNLIYLHLIKKYLSLMKNIWYLRKYTCIQQNIFTFNPKYLYSMKSILAITYENIILTNRSSKILFMICFIFNQFAINCVMISSKKSGLYIRSISGIWQWDLHKLALCLEYDNEQPAHSQEFLVLLGKSEFSCCEVSNTAKLHLNKALESVILASCQHLSGVSILIAFGALWKF